MPAGNPGAYAEPSNAPMPPPPGGGAGPADVAAAQDQSDAARVDTLAAAAPVPEGDGIPVADLERVSKELDGVLDAANKALDKAELEVPVEPVPLIEWSAPEGVKFWDQPIPPALFLPLAMLAQAAEALGFGKHSFDPQSLTSSGAAKKIGGKLHGMAKDKKFIEALVSTEAPPPEVEAPPASGPPAEYAEDDPLAAAM